jgi:hypothetical protein
MYRSRFDEEEDSLGFGALFCNYARIVSVRVGVFGFVCCAARQSASAARET